MEGGVEAADHAGEGTGHHADDLTLEGLDVGKFGKAGELGLVEDAALVESDFEGWEAGFFGEFDDGFDGEYGIVGKNSGAGLGDVFEWDLDVLFAALEGDGEEGVFDDFDVAVLAADLFAEVIELVGGEALVVDQVDGFAVVDFGEDFLELGLVFGVRHTIKI